MQWQEIYYHESEFFTYSSTLNQNPTQSKYPCSNFLLKKAANEMSAKFFACLDYSHFFLLLFATFLPGKWNSPCRLPPIAIADIYWHNAIKCL